MHNEQKSPAPLSPKPTSTKTFSIDFLCIILRRSGFTIFGFLGPFAVVLFWKADKTAKFRELWGGGGWGSENGHDEIPKKNSNGEPKNQQTTKHIKNRRIIPGFWGGFVLCVFSPIRNDSKQHININLPPAQSRDNPAKVFMRTCFLFPWSKRVLLGDFKAQSAGDSCEWWPRMLGGQGFWMTSDLDPSHPQDMRAWLSDFEAQHCNTPLSR